MRFDYFKGLLCDLIIFKKKCVVSSWKSFWVCISVLLCHNVPHLPEHDDVWQDQGEYIFGMDVQLMYLLFFLCKNAIITIIPAWYYLFSLPMLRPTCSANSSLATLETTRQQREPLRAQFSFEKRCFHTQFIANWVRLKVSQQYRRWFTHSDVAHFHYIDPYVNIL